MTPAVAGGGELLPARPPAAQAHALRAAAAGGRAARDDRPGRTLGWIRADGQIAGHRVRIFTAITEETP